MNYKTFYIPNKSSLKNKIILIINIKKNIDKKLMTSIIKCGAKIIILEKSINKLSKIYDHMKLYKKNIFLYPLCSSFITQKDYYKMARIIYKNFGRIDGLIYNIPKIKKSSPFEQINLKELQKELNTNFYKKLIIIKILMPLIKLSKNASIIFTTHNIKSLNTYWSTYNCFNSALKTLIKIIYEEYKNILNIKINQIQLDKNNNDLYKKEFPGIEKKNIKNIKNLINIYIYLISDKNKKIKNKTIIINQNSNIYKI